MPAQRVQGPGALWNTAQNKNPIWMISNTGLSKARFQAGVQGIATGAHYFLVSYLAVAKSTRKNGCYIQKNMSSFSFLLLDIGIDPRQGLGHAKHTVSTTV